MTAIESLIKTMLTLREPGGCPWDREQTHESIISYLIEEAHETEEALADHDWNEFKEELGDVLCQIVFHSQIADEAGRFNFDDICKILEEKLVRRHPHVFADTQVSGSDEVLKNWELIKKEEKKNKSKDTSVLSGVPKNLPALMRAYRLGQKAARVGFEFPDLEEVFEKVTEELAELKEEIFDKKVKDPETLTGELGDLLFSLVNLARHLDIKPEEALLKTTRKFQKRFEFIEAEIAKHGKTMREAKLDEMDALWNEAKKR
jgi:tetrapyrrole methylase family protein / MazG family protein